MLTLNCILLLTALLLVQAKEIDQDSSRAIIRRKGHQFKQDILGSFGGIVQGVAGGHHRLGLILPLLMMIAGRLATLIPVAMSGLIGIGLMVLFAKKAFVVSMTTLAIVLYDRWALWKKSQVPAPVIKEEIHIHAESEPPIPYLYKRKNSHYPKFNLLKARPNFKANHMNIPDGLKELPVDLSGI